MLDYIHFIIIKAWLFWIYIISFFHFLINLFRKYTIYFLYFVISNLIEFSSTTKTCLDIYEKHRNTELCFGYTNSKEKC